jgi:lysozyme
MYTVQAGDTFETIADKHGLKLTELLDANPSLLQVGAKLKIPGGVSLPEIPADTDEDISTQPDGASGGTTDVTAGTRNHVVQIGDTLSAIASKYNTTVDAIMAINPQIRDRNIILLGQKIKIP